MIRIGSLSPMALLALLVVAMAVSGCTSNARDGTGGSTGDEAAASSTVVLTVNGSVSNPLQLTTSDLMAYRADTANASYRDYGIARNATYGGNRTGPYGVEYGNASMGGYGGWPADDTGSSPAGSNGNRSRGDYGNMSPGDSGNGPAAGSGVNSDTGFAGFSISSLIDKAGPSEAATEVTLIGTDGTTATVSLSDLRGQPGAMIVSRSNGLQAFVPGARNVTWINGLVAIEID